MRDSLVQFITANGLIPPGSTVLCAVSGGADSVYLLHRLNALRQAMDFRLTAAHYNHCLRGEESDGDEAFVRQLVELCCGPRRVPGPDGAWTELPGVTLLVGRGDVAGEAQRTGRGLEETARRMRYDFLTQAAEEVGAHWIATAHTANDNGETLLLHLTRGSGLRGLGGIPPRRGTVIRPMLTTTRAQVEEYLRYYGIPWREDVSNRDMSYARNRLRSQVIPQLEQLNPNLMERLFQTAASLREDEEYLMEQALKELGPITCGPDCAAASAAALARLPRPLALRAARGLIAAVTQGNDNCTAAHLEGLADLCRSGDPSARMDLPNGLTARRVYDEIRLSRVRPTVLSPVPLAMPGATWAGGWMIQCSLEVYVGQSQQPMELYLSQAAAPAIRLRPRQTGDRLKRPKRPGKTVKKWFIEEKIPAADRDGLPVFTVDGQIAAVAGLGPDEAFLPRMGEMAWHLRCVPDGAQAMTETDTL